MNFEVLLNILLELLTTIGLKLLYAVIVLFVGLKLIKWLKKRLPAFPFMERLDAGIRSFLCSSLAIALYVLLFISIAMILGIPTTSFIAALASCLAAIGLAMQGSLSNFAGGLMILMFKPFRVGDYISAPELNVEGFVREITVVYTVLRTFDNIEVTIPNGTLSNSVLKDMSIAETRRVDINFRTDPHCSLEKTEAVLREVIEADDRVLHDPEPAVWLTDITDSALVYSVRIWCPGSEYWPTKFGLTRAVKVAFDKNGITVPHNQLDVHLNAPGNQDTRKP